MRISFIAVAALALASSAHAEEKYWGYPLGILPEDTTLVTLNTEGKRKVAEGLRDWRKLWERGGFEKLREGEPCLAPKDTTVAIIEEVPEESGRVIVLGIKPGKGRCPLYLDAHVPYSVVVKAKAEFLNRLPKVLKR